MKVLAFGVAKEILGSGSVDIAVDRAVTIDVLKAKLEERYPELKQLSSFMIAVNSEYALPGMTINVTDEIAIIPPVSGG